MSTRSQIVVQAEKDTPVKVSTEEITYGTGERAYTSTIAKVEGAHPFCVYKHSDGYPTGVLPVLVPFAENFGKHRGHDPEYCIAQIIRAFAIAEFEHAMAWDAKEKEMVVDPSGYSLEYKKGITHAEGEKLRVTGWGVDSGIHGDIEYLYVVNSATGTVETYCDEGEGWNLIEPEYGPELYVDVA